MRRNTSSKPPNTSIQDSNNTIVIVCERQNVTERKYFDNFKGKHSLVEVRVTGKNKTRTPLELVKHAAEYEKSLGLNLEPGGDSIWCVLDVESASYKLEEKSRNMQLGEAKKLADKLNVKLALSNPSFELWFLLHFRDWNSQLDNKALMRELNKWIPNYDKTKCYYKSHLKDRKAALGRAHQLEKNHERNERDLYLSESNPSTRVFELLNEIEQLRSKYK